MTVETMTPTANERAGESSVDSEDAVRAQVEKAQDAEEVKRRLEREYGELFEEIRVLIPGAEVLFGFLLAIRFTQQFAELSSVQEYVYYVTLLSTAVALVLLLAPAVHHRLRFREGDKEYLLRNANREAIAGSAAIALAFSGALFVVTDLIFGTVAAMLVVALFVAFTAWRWWAVALYRAQGDGSPT
jgi:uncharacterized membrane protein YcjF (UPF0283 family)